MDDIDRQSNETGLEIAVIGMAGRFPGAKNVWEFRKNLEKGVCSISFFTDEELLEAGVDTFQLRNPNYVKAKGLLEGKEFFDAAFFDFTPRDAELMDPQIRVFQECCWEALEDAGYDPGAYNGLIGLYAGGGRNLPWEILCQISGKHDEAGELAVDTLTNINFLCTQAAYRLNLQGAAVMVQSACSTSLLSIHLAGQGLLSGECHMAIAGGVNVSGIKMSGYLYQEGMVKSDDGHCRAFDARARGMVEGEGVGAVVLKPLADAQDDGDYIYAVIKGAAINNDGNVKVGYSAPGVKGQEAVIKAALQAAGVEAESIAFVETHGTATPLGDSIEIQALKHAYNSSPKRSCALGSVKTNIGHLDAAAGVAGFIKTVLALKYRQLYPSLHFESPNPALDLENSPFFVNACLSRWERNRYPRRAAVSAFGIGGTNTHLILEEWTGVQGAGAGTHIPPAPEQDLGQYRLVLLSAGSEPALEQMTANLAGHFKQNPGTDLANAAYTLQVGRRVFAHRKMVLCRDAGEAGELLSSSTPEPVRVPHSSVKPGKKFPVFMFPGHGSQYVNMGGELYRTEPVFREEMDRCFEILRALMKEDIKALLYPAAVSSGSSPAGSLIQRIDIAQAAVFIVEYALAQLLRSWGIKADAMIGYSLGEYTAACCAGVFSPADALKLIVYKGQLLRELPEGAMLSVPLPAEELLPIMGSELSLAIDNGPSCIISGPVNPVSAFENRMKNREIFCMKVQSPLAGHSRMLEPVLKKFTERAREIKLNKPRIPFISNLTGTWIEDRQATDPAYWAAHLRETMHFAAGIKTLLEEPGGIFLELGPGHDLSTLLVRYTENRPDRHTVNLMPHSGEKVPAHYFLLRQIGQLWLYGINPDWQQFYRGENRQRIPLPAYPFASESRRYWLDGELFNPGTGSSLLPPRQRKKKDLAGWFYVPSWELAPLPPPQKPSMFQRDPVLVFMDDDGFAGRLLNRPEMESHRFIKVYAGSAFKKNNDDGYEIDPRQEEGYTRLMSDLYGSGSIPGAVIHCWGVTSHPGAENELEREAMENILARVFYSLIYMVKAKNHAIHAQGLDIYVITNHIYQVTGEEELWPVKASALGPCCSIPREFPGLRCKLMDIVYPGEPGAAGNEPRDRMPDRTLDLVLAEMAAGTRDSVIAFRGRQRWGRAFKPLRLEAAANPKPFLREKGVYLITGGPGNHGSVGFILATYLATRAGAKILFISRTPLPPREEWQQGLEEHRNQGDDSGGVAKKIRLCLELENLGAEVLYLNADVSDPVQLKQAVLQGEKRFGTINGVIHSAAVVDETSNLGLVICDTHRQECEKQFDSKIYGLVNLYRLFEKRDLDFCFLNSSVASIMGPLAAYSAGNNFMDALVWRLSRDHPQRWLCANWDKWQHWKGDWKKELELSMTPAEGIEAFHRILAWDNARQVVVYPGDLQATLAQLVPGRETGTASLFRRHADISNWFYIPAWKKSALPADPKGRNLSSTSWLVFTNETPLAVRLSEKLEQQGADVVTAAAGPGFAGSGKGKYTVNPQNPEDYHRLFNRLAEHGRIPGKILHLWYASEDDNPQCRWEDLDHTQDLGLYSLLHIARSLGRQPVNTPVQLGVVSTHLQPVTGKEMLCPVKAAVLGPVKIIPVEYANIRCFSIDIPAAAVRGRENEILDDELIREFAVDSSRPRLAAYREGERYIREIEPVSLSQPPASRLRLKERGIYMITGGLGGIGFILAGYLARHFHARLILTDISGFPLQEDTTEKIKDMENRGAEVLVRQADVSSFREMENVFLEAETRFGKIDGIIHAAGLIDYAGVIQHRTRQMTEDVLAARIKGTLVLDRLLPKRPLDFLVLFSSVGNMLSRIKFGQVGYNAGHEFLDLFAYYKQQQGTFTVTIDWSDWLEVGMAVEATRHREARTEVVTRFEEAISMTPREGTEAFLRLLGNSHPQVAVCPADLVQLMDYMFGSQYEDLEFFAPPRTLQARPQLSTEYIAPQGPGDQVLAEIFRKIFGYERIGIGDDFFELGGDSLKAMTAITQIHKRLNIKIPMTEFFKRRSIEGLTGYIRGLQEEVCLSIEPVEEKEYYGLSSAQKRMFILNQIDRASTGYNLTILVPLWDGVEKDRMASAFQRLIHRHESLRTSFQLVDENPVQRVHREVDFEIRYYDSKDKAGNNPSDLAAMVNRIVCPFDLARAPLLRVGLIETGALNDLLLVDMHHIISDRISCEILEQDFMALYREESLPPLRIRYKDYSGWQQERHTRENAALKKQEAYWLNQFQDEIPVANIPTDYERPAVQSFEGSLVYFEIDQEQTRALKQLVLREETTLYTVLLTIFYVFLAKISLGEDFVVGTDIAGRPHADLESIMGMFVNTLALRNYPAGEKTFHAFLKEVKERTLQALENQDYQFENLVENVVKKRDPSRNPLFDIMFALDNIAKPTAAPPGKKFPDPAAIPDENGSNTAKFDLILAGEDRGESLLMRFEYSTKLFKKETIARFIDYFREIIAIVIEDSALRLEDINIFHDFEDLTTNIFQEDATDF